MKQCFLTALSSLCLLLAISTMAQGEDWTQFRGSAGNAISPATKLPATWSETENLLWKVEMPGAGSSSPIILGDKIFVTSYSGYGMPKSKGGEIDSLERHLVCVSRTTGKILWSKTIKAVMPEDKYQGYISEHGYASNTPVTDGERIYVFFGKSGVLAFDLEGNQLWQTSVGTGSSNRQWGSAASLVLYKDMVIVNASEESKAIIALNKTTGKEVWKVNGPELELSYCTPALVTLPDQRVELVIALPGEIWGFNPDTGKNTWYAIHQLTGNICPSIITQGDMVYVFGGFRSAGSFAIRAGGQGNVTKTELKWSSRNSSYVATPVLHEGHLYWISDQGQAICITADKGEQVYRERVAGLSTGGRPVYASPVVANGKIYIPTRWKGVIVLPAKPEYQVLAQNKFDSDESDFNATPAISNEQMFLRSDRFLYCVAEQVK